MKNKFILITLIFFIIFSFLLSSFSFAAEARFEFDYNNEHFSFPTFDHSKNFIIYRNGTSITLLHFADSVDVSKFYYDAEASYTNRLVLLDNKVSYCKAQYDKSYMDEWYNVQYPNFTTFNSTVNYCKLPCAEIIYSTFDVKNYAGEIIFGKYKNKAFIENKSQIETGKFDKVIVNSSDYTSNELYLLTYWFTENTDNPFETMLPRKIIPLKTLNNFYVGTKNEKAIYEVPFGYTGIDLVER